MAIAKDMVTESLKRRLRRRLKPGHVTRKLSADQIAALLERAASGHPIPEIAADYGVTPRNVRYHIAKACR